METELQFHIEARAEHLMASGLSADAARRRAREELGDARRWKEAGREARGLSWLDGLVNDVRQGLRLCRRSPAFAATAIVSMAIAIGANTAIFSLVNTVILRPLPVEHPNQLVLFSGSGDTQALGSSFPYPYYRELRQTDDVLSGVLASASMNPTLEMAGDAERVNGELVSGNYFDVLGIKPYLGRLMTDADERTGASVVVLDYLYWQRRFAGDEGTIGKPILLNRRAMTVIGVTPPDFYGIQQGDRPKLRVPISLQPAMHGGNSFLETSQQWWLQIIGRTKPGVSRTQAADVLNGHFRHFLAQVPPEGVPERLELLDGSQGRPTARRQFQQPLMILTALVAIVLLLVCVNVGNLLLARATSRQPEMALRLALGAGRLRIMRQLAVEALVLATAGGAAGLWLSYWGARTLAALAGAPSEFGIPIDLRVLGYASLVTGLTGLLCGLSPAWSSARVNLVTSLKSETAQITFERMRGRRVLLAGQIALTLALVVAAGLFARTLFNLRYANFGFDAERLALATINPVLTGYSRDRLGPFYDEVLRRVTALPTVESASLAVMPLLAGDLWGSGLTLDTGEHDDKPGPTRNAIGLGFFHTVGLSLREGRDFDRSDTKTSEPVAIVNDAFVRRYFGGGRALGRRIGPGGPGGVARYTVVGVVRDSKIAQVREPETAFWYVPLEQLSNRDQLTLHVRSTGAPEDALADVRRAVAAVDKSVPLLEAATLRQQIEEQVEVERLMAILAGAFAILAILLAWLGLHGVMSYMTAARTREFRIRMALGATPGSIVGLLARQSAVVIAAGVVAGVALSWLAASQVRSLLFELEPADPATILAALGIVITATTLAAILPARKASKVDPALTLR
jgi:predicted permease